MGGGGEPKGELRGHSDDRHAPSPLPARAGWLKKILNGPNGQLERAMDDILVTSDLTSRYKISRKTLWSWQSADTMPRGFVCPFPPPDWPGNPNRWRSESIKEWEDKKKIN
ncbi:conserved domain protein [Escherichia coli H736]|nr:conserved domain protein [Escherichia coli H736]